MKQAASILIIDDDANIRELLNVNLQAHGYSVKTAENGLAGLEMVRKNPPDLIILDVMMPETDGWEVCKVIRDNPELKKLKVLMLTAKGSDKDRMLGKAVFGADEYMSKPFDIDRLLNTVAELLHE
jgi:DNA-binding response OmpR family regulator